MYCKEIEPEKQDIPGRYYACIDLKSFYASVECVERGLDPFTTNLVVADPDRESGTICLAITPAMKALGVKNRCRVFEIPRGIEYIMAKPRMRLYVNKSADIYGIYLRYISPDDIHVYSIDECFIDLTPYLKLYHTTPMELVRRLTDAVFQETGITATAGVGTNLFLAKIALDVMAKRAVDGLGFLDRDTFLKKIQPHRPITDIWQVGGGIARRLARYGVYDLEGVARLPEEVLYREFGVNAEYLIDHANGVEPCTMADIKAYRPSTNSHSVSQILFEPYSFDEAKIILREMVEGATLDLVCAGKAAGTVAMSIAYNREGKFNDPKATRPPTGSSMRLSRPTNSLSYLTELFLAMYDRTTDPHVPVRRVALSFGMLVDERDVEADMFTDTEAEKREHSLLDAIVSIKSKFGKNSILRGHSFEAKATTRARNLMIGGHNADVDDDGENANNS